MNDAILISGRLSLPHSTITTLLPSSQHCCFILLCKGRFKVHFLRFQQENDQVDTYAKGYMRSPLDMPGV